MPLQLIVFCSGQPFPIHPLDLTFTVQDVTWDYSPSNTITTTLCLGEYQTGIAPFPGIDLVLGDGFLRNVYTSYVTVFMILLGVFA